MEPNTTIKVVTNINATNLDELPYDMQFTEAHIITIATYSVLMAISLAGNSTVFVLLYRRRRTNQSRINTMLLHLAVADLLVTLLMMPLEIAWAITVQWTAGDIMCRIMAFVRIYGIYLSSFVLVCISIDRYYAVLKPLELLDTYRRGKIMLVMAWVGSAVCSAPQVFIFHVANHPDHKWYKQCVTFDSLSERNELIYSFFTMAMMYWLPLTVIIYTYSSIIYEIYKKTKESAADRIRRSSMGFLGRAKIRTLKMTIVIVLVFFVCWTPYYIMCVWYWLDKESARKVDLRIQKFLFFFACTNSCMNPIVYGIFNIRREHKKSTFQQQEATGNKRETEEFIFRVSWHRTVTYTSNQSNSTHQSASNSNVNLNVINRSFMRHN